MKRFISFVFSLALLLPGLHAFSHESYEILAERTIILPEARSNHVIASRCSLLGADVTDQTIVDAGKKAFITKVRTEVDFEDPDSGEITTIINDTRPTIKTAQGILQQIIRSEEEAGALFNPAERRKALSCLHADTAGVTYNAKTNPIRPVMEYSECGIVEASEAGSKFVDLMDQLCIELDDKAPVPSREEIGVPEQEEEQLAEVTEAPAEEEVPEAPPVVAETEAPAEEEAAPPAEGTVLKVTIEGLKLTIPMSLLPEGIVPPKGELAVSGGNAELASSQQVEQSGLSSVTQHVVLIGS